MMLVRALTMSPLTQLHLPGQEKHNLLLSLFQTSLYLNRGRPIHRIEGADVLALNVCASFICLIQI